jgi:WD40 repeat protein
MSWDPKDGRCLVKASVLSGKATEMKTLRSGRHIVACGFFPAIVIINASNLNPVRVLPTHQSSYILSSVVFFYAESSASLGEGVLSMSMECNLESFSLRNPRSPAGTAPQSRGPIKRSRLHCDDGIAISVNYFTNSTILVIRKAIAEVYNLAGLEFLISIPCPDPQGWSGGVFVRHTEVLLYQTNGVARRYMLPASLGLQTAGRAHLFKPQERDETSAEVEDRKIRERARNTRADPVVPLEQFLSGDAADGAVDPYNGFGSYQFATDVLNHRIVSIDHDSNIRVWSMSKDAGAGAGSRSLVEPFASVNIIAELESKHAENAIEGLYTECFNNIACYTPISADTIVFGYLTGSLRIISLGELLGMLFEHPKGFPAPTPPGPTSGADAAVLPESNGQPAPANGASGAATASGAKTTAASSFGVQPEARQEATRGLFADGGAGGGSINVIRAHRGSVTKLLHPFYHGASVDSAIFVSGSSDCCIKVWKLGTLQHTFKNQAGVIVNLLCPPASSALLKRGCFCSIASDHSFAIYSIDAMSCLHIISGLASPVHEVRWRCADDFVVLWCGGDQNHTVYVWQLSSGHLDRKATGQLALDILAACPAAEPAHGLAHVTRKVLLAQGIGFRLLDLSSELGMVPLLIINVEEMIAGLSRRSSSKMDAAVVASAERSREVLRVACGILLSHRAPSVDWFDSFFTSLCIPCNPVHFTLGLYNSKDTAVSLMFPGLQDHPEQRWLHSNHASTAYLLATTSILHALHRTERPESETEKYWLEIMGDFTNHNQVKQLPTYMKPSLLQLALLWEHPQHDIQRVARTQLTIQLNEVMPAERQEIVRWAISRIPQAPKDRQDEQRIGAVILLGIIARTDRTAIRDGGTIELVAKALTAIVEDKAISARHRAGAAEILGQAYDVLEEFCDLSAVFLILIELTSSTSATGTGAAPLHALKNLASANFPQFIESVNHQLFHANAGSFTGHNSMLKVLRLLVKTHAPVLEDELSRVVDVVVRCFDPSTPPIREACFKQAKQVLHEMCITYDSMDIYEARLAVGTVEGLINVYDLKSATRWQAIPAHPSPVSSIAFSQEGKMLASLSGSEGCIKVWHIGTSFFGMLSSSAPKSAGTFELRGKLDGISPKERDSLVLAWTRKKTLMLVYPNKLELEFKVA